MKHKVKYKSGDLVKINSSLYGYKCWSILDPEKIGWLTGLILKDRDKVWDQNTYWPVLVGTIVVTAVCDEIYPYSYDGDDND